MTEPYKFRDADGRVRVELDPDGFGRNVSLNDALRLADRRALKYDFEGASGLIQVLDSEIVHLHHLDDPRMALVK